MSYQLSPHRHLTEISIKWRFQITSLCGIQLFIILKIPELNCCLTFAVVYTRISFKKRREGDFNIKKRGCPSFRFFSNLIIHLFWNIPLRFRKNQKTSPFSRWPIAIGHQEIVYTMSGSARTSANQTAAFVLVNKWNSTYKISLLYILCFRHAWIKVG